jgi:hypothetical protein
VPLAAPMSEPTASPLEFADKPHGERENTKMLQLLRALCLYHGLAEAADVEVDEMLRETEPAIIAPELEKHLPSDINQIRNNTGGENSN